MEDPNPDTEDKVTSDEVVSQGKVGDIARRMKSLGMVNYNVEESKSGADVSLQVYAGNKRPAKEVKNRQTVESAQKSDLSLLDPELGHFDEALQSPVIIDDLGNRYIFFMQPGYGKKGGIAMRVAIVIEPHVKGKDPLSIGITLTHDMDFDRVKGITRMKTPQFRSLFANVPEENILKPEDIRKGTDLYMDEMSAPDNLRWLHKLYDQIDTSIDGDKFDIFEEKKDAGGKPYPIFWSFFDKILDFNDSEA